MPISNLFNNTSLETGYSVASLQTISATDHNTTLAENRNKHLYTQSNADTATGGTFIESRYIANSAVTSAKINLQAGKIFNSNGAVSSPSSIAWNQVWTSPQFGQFSIIWEKAFMSTELDFQANWSIDHSVASNPVKMWIYGDLLLYAIENGTPVLVEAWSNNDYNFKFEHIRDGYAQDNGSSTTGNGVYQDVYNRHCKALYTNTSGQASTNFYFVGNIQNKTRYLGTNVTPNYGTIGIRETFYKTFNQIHS